MRKQNIVKNNIVKQPDFLLQNILEECENIIKDQNLSQEAVENIISNTISITEEFSKPLIQLYKDVSSRYPKIFSNITPDLFLRIIKHLRKIANQKIENRNIGVNIVVFSKSVFGNYTDYFMCANSPNEDDIVDEKGIFNGDINGIQRVYKCIDQKEAFVAYTYDIDNKELHYKKLYSFSNGTRTMEEICIGNAIGFSVLDGVPCIRIYFEGSIIADYYMSESTGDWCVRFVKDIFNAIKAQCKHLLNDNAVALIAEISMQLSYSGIGTTLLITKESNLSSSAPCTIAQYNLEAAKKEKHIYNCAKYDGAVIIQAQKDKNAILNNFGVMLEPSSDIVLNREYNLLLEQTNSGTRHRNAVKYAYEHKEDCIIVISENRTISIIHGRTPIYWRDNPKPLEMISHLINKKNVGRTK